MDLKNPDCRAQISGTRKRQYPRERNLNKREAGKKIERERKSETGDDRIRVRVRVRVTLRERVG
jgi:hypothetical protein